MNSISWNLVGIYRSSLLPASETFIPLQTETLSQFRAMYCGVRRVDGLALPDYRTIVVNKGGLTGRFAEVFFRQFRKWPTFESAVASARFVLLHAHFGPDACEILPTAERLRVPLVVTFHGYDATCSDDVLRRVRPGRRYLRRRELLKERTKLFLANSRFVMRRLLEAGFPEERLRLH